MVRERLKERATFWEKGKITILLEVNNNNSSSSSNKYSLLGTGKCARCFQYINSFDPHNDLTR